MGNVLIWGIRTYICLLLLHRGSGLTYSADKKFVTVLQSVKAWRGSCILLPCTHSYPEVISNYTWYHNPVYDKQKKEFNGEKVYNSLSNTGIDSLFENNVEYRGTKEKDCTILIKNLTNEHSGQYGLRLFHSSSDFKWMSKTYVNVTVSDAGPGIEIEPVPEIKEFQLVTLTCSIKYHCPLHNISLSWMEDINGTAKTEIRYDTRDISTKTSLTFRPSWADHNKNFTCFLHQWDQEKNESQSVQLKVTYPPKGVKIILEPDSKIFREGTKVKFACFVSSSNPRVTSIAWLKDNKKVSTFMEEISISAEDSGMYTCQAGNNIGQSFSQPVSVEVHYPPKAAKIKIVKGSETKQGDQVTLKCSADSGNPKLIHYEWLKDGELYKSTGVSDSLLINLTWKDSGYYSCAASNSVGKSTSKSAILNVQYAPQNVTLSITPGNHVTEYTDVMLRCQAQSNPQCQYSLYKDNQLLKVNEYLALGNIQRSDTGEYRCSARNTVGVQKSEVVHLYVAYSWYTIGIYISSVLGSLTLFIIFVILIVHFRVWKKNCKKTADDSSFFVLKKQSHNESHTGQDTPSANSSTDCLNYSTLQFPAGGNGQIKQPRLERNREDPSAIYSTVKKSHTAAEYENIESSKKVHDGAQDEIHYSVIANLPKEGSQRKQDPEVEYAMLRH